VSVALSFLPPLLEQLLVMFIDQIMPMLLDVGYDKLPDEGKQVVFDLGPTMHVLLSTYGSKLAASTQTPVDDALVDELIAKLEDIASKDDRLKLWSPPE